MTIGCSHPDCNKLATRQTLIELAGQRSAGEKMLVWVCNAHANHVSPGTGPKRGLVQRLMMLANVKTF